MTPYCYNIIEKNCFIPIDNQISNMEFKSDNIEMTYHYTYINNKAAGVFVFKVDAFKQFYSIGDSIIGILREHINNL